MSFLNDYIVTIDVEQYIDVRARTPEVAVERAVAEAERTYGKGGKSIKVRKVEEV